jgi:hypothetical protein
VADKVNRTVLAIRRDYKLTTTLRNMTNSELLRYVVTLPHKTPLEKELHDRLVIRLGAGG